MSEEYEKPFEAPPKTRLDSKLTDLLEDIVYLLPGCSDLIIRKELAIAWRIFANRTEAYVVTATRPLKVGCKEYKFPIPGNYTVKSVFYAYYQGENNNQEVLFSGYEDNTMLVIDLPEATTNSHATNGFKNLAVCMSLVPNRGCEDIPKWILDKYGSAIVAGVVYRLAAQEGKPWANAVLASQNMIEWENAQHEVACKRIENNGKIDVTNYEGWA